MGTVNRFEKILNKEGPKPVVLEVQPINTNSIDPRPDLSQDSLLWQQLLAAAQDIDYRLFGALLCMRRTGVKIARNPSGSLRLVPHIDPTGATGWTSQAEYDSQKGEILDQVKGPLIELLGKMAA